MNKELTSKIEEIINQFNQQYTGPIKANYKDGFIHEIYTNRKYMVIEFCDLTLLPEFLNNINNTLKDDRIYEFMLQTAINNSINIEDTEPKTYKFEFDNFDINIETGLFAASVSICYDSINDRKLKDLLVNVSYDIINIISISSTQHRYTTYKLPDKYNDEHLYLIVRNITLHGSIYDINDEDLEGACELIFSILDEKLKT